MGWCEMGTKIKILEMFIYFNAITRVGKYPRR